MTHIDNCVGCGTGTEKWIIVGGKRIAWCGFAPCRTYIWAKEEGWWSKQTHEEERTKLSRTPSTK